MLFFIAWCCLFVSFVLVHTNIARNFLVALIHQPAFEIPLDFTLGWQHC